MIQLFNDQIHKMNSKARAFLQQEGHQQVILSVAVNHVTK